VQFHDHSQHVTIGISSDHVPAGVRLQSARFRVLECMPQIGEGTQRSSIAAQA